MQKTLILADLIKTGRINMKYNLITLLILFSNTLFAQTGQAELKNITPGYKENKYPEVDFPVNPKVAKKINTFMQVADLEHLPGVFKKHPFEKVTYGANENSSSVDFYSWKRFKTTKNILSFAIEGEASGAYPEGFESFYNFDLRTGDPILLKTLFTGTAIPQLEKILNKKVKTTIADYLKTIRPDPKEKKTDQGRRRRFV
ncbi:hypothetical protein TH53_21325 [Pedobacter lusitanus]|uniref:Uncharacterized protein n=2 Tax=Pedobacter lusitanus TaxID=1503925 RepID=A0A0D0GLQ9_9SPHI|nr:hypothetical protein TH53_21325 [Pedobacter lusitanus]